MSSGTRRWFGTDGVRGRAGEGPLATPFLVRLGRALGEQVAADGGGEVLLARDTRASGPAIVSALADGLASAGARVIDLGVLPTPGLALAMRARRSARGAVVSASHNPWQDNGVKLFGPGGHKLSDGQEHALEDRVVELGGEGEGALPAELEEAADVPLPAREDGARGYVDEMLERFAGLDLSGRRLVVDCAHGAASETGPTVLERLGATVEAICTAPDGRNINARCGSTHLETLAEAVRRAGAELGLAFDGDADRVLFVDAGGRECHGDHMLGLLGTWMADGERLPQRTVVATVMSNLGLERMLGERSIQLLRTAVGDRYVNAAMREGGYGLGGEASGHLLFGAEHENTGDGLYTALKVLTALGETGRSVADAIDAVPVIPQVLLNVPVADRPPLDQLPALQERVAAAEGRHGADIRIVLRYSGTEKLARVMVEGVDADVVQGLADELAALWVEEIGIHTS